MSELSFEWEAGTAASNAAKHGVTFEEATTVFHDEDALVIPDPDPDEEPSSSWDSAAVSESWWLSTASVKRIIHKDHLGQKSWNQGNETIPGA